MTRENAIVAGVAMNKFVKPGQQEPYRVMASEVIGRAVEEAGIEPSQIEQAYAGYIYGDSTCGQHAFYDAFQTGIPVFNVNNACASGSTALFLARQAVESGVADCVLAFGFEEMQPGALSSPWNDREAPGDRQRSALREMSYSDGQGAILAFGAAGEHYLDKYDADPELFAKVSVKTRSHAINNPFSLFSEPLTVDEVMQSKPIYRRLTRLMACPPTCGAAAAIVVSQSFARRNGLSGGVEILGQVLATDTADSWKDPMRNVGLDMTLRASRTLYEQTGLGPRDAQLVELHDCFTPNEVITYEGLGLCEEGGASKFVNDRDNTYGGKWVVNPSGGLMSKGHPIGATGLAQCYELVQQLRGKAGKRQVEKAKIALQHNLGLSGAVVVTMYGNAN